MIMTLSTLQVTAQKQSPDISSQSRVIRFLLTNFFQSSSNEPRGTTLVFWHLLWIKDVPHKLIPRLFLSK